MFRNSVEVQKIRQVDPSNSLQPLVFMNREKECEKVAKLFLANRRKRDLQASQFGSQSQYRLTLATCAQMFGSGKSTFGCNLLPRLRDNWFAERRRIIQRELKYSNNDLSWLLSLQYVGVDMRKRRMGMDFVEALRLCLFTELQKLVSDKSRAMELACHLAGKTCKDIVSTFESEVGKSFLIHLDEFSTINESEREKDSIELYYKVWGEISQIHVETESELFCSGRSATMYLLGKGWIGQKKSPEDAECIILDPLEQEHVKTIFEKFDVVDEEKKFFIKLHEFIAGVPRFVAHAVDFFTPRHPSVDKELAKNRRDNFQYDTSEFQNYLCQEAYQEMNPFCSINHKQHEFFVEMIRIASLGLPINLDAKIIGSRWGLDADSITLHLCSVYPLYLKKYSDRGASDRCVIIIPPVVLRNISSTCKHSRIPFWASLYKTNPIQASTQSTGNVLELMAQQCLRLRVSEELNQGEKTVGEVLEFVKDSKIAGLQFQPNTEQAFKKFPKITLVSKPGKTTEKLQMYLKDPDTAGFSDVHPDDLAELYRLLEPGFFYVPHPMSSSADLIFVTDGKNKVFVEWQFKNGSQKVDACMLKEELGKPVCCRRPNTFQAVFIMVALTIGDLPVGHHKVCSADGCPIAVQYEESTHIIGKFYVPKGLQVIVVLHSGLQTFLTEQNIGVLQDGEVTLDQISAAIASPSRKRTRVMTIHDSDI